MQCLARISVFIHYLLHMIVQTSISCWIFLSIKFTSMGATLQCRPWSSIYHKERVVGCSHMNRQPRPPRPSLRRRRRWRPRRRSNAASGSLRRHLWPGMVSILAACHTEFRYTHHKHNREHISDQDPASLALSKVEYKHASPDRSPSTSAGGFAHFTHLKDASQRRVCLVALTVYETSDVDI